MKQLITLAILAAAFAAKSAQATNYSVSFIDDVGVELLEGRFSVDDQVNELDGVSEGLLGRTITSFSGTYKGYTVSLESNPNAPSFFTKGDYTYNNQLLERTGTRLDSYGLLFSYNGTAANLLGDLSFEGNDYAIIDGRDFFVGNLVISEIAAAVPEPAAWTMMLVGFGMMGGALRYRRRGSKVTYA